MPENNPSPEIEKQAEEKQARASEKVDAVLDYRIQELLENLAKVMGMHHSQFPGYLKGDYERIQLPIIRSLEDLIGFASHKKSREAQRDKAFLPIKTTALSLLRMYFDAEELDEDGDWNADRDILVEAARKVILGALKDLENQ
jgi:hypothetical protein